MRQFFNMEGPIFGFLSKMADLFILNMLFIITSIPIITIGASLTALSYATLKMHSEDEGYAWKNYLKAWKNNVKQATLIWLIMLAAAAVLYFDYRVCRINTGAAFMVVRYVTLVGALLWLMILYYVFPMQSRFENTVINTIVNATLLAISNLPRTILMFLITGGLVAATLWNSRAFAFGLMLWILFGAAFISWVNSSLISKIFKKLIPEEEAKEEENDNINLEL